MILFGLPLFDTTSVMITRARKGESIFKADKNHVHHRLLRKGLTQKQATYLLYIVSATLSFLAVLFTWKQTPEIIMGGICVIIAVVFWKIWLWKLRKRPL
jgi:UDP-GlcNAc:undecaprenyl-phosphate GlcNAc-1-phosphate transferase